MRVNTEAEMLKLGQFFGQNLHPPVVIELVGDVGAGKTTFTRGLAEGLDINEPITSPSFTISKRYHLPRSTGGELVHYDFYRLPDPGIMRDELAETIDSSNLVVIEWAGVIENLLPDDRITLKFVLNADGSREILETGLDTDLWKTCGKLFKDCGKPVENFSQDEEKLLDDVEKFSKSVEKAAETVLDRKARDLDINSIEQSAENIDSQNKVHEKSSILESSIFVQKFTIKNQLTALPVFLDTSSNNCQLQIGEQYYSWSADHTLSEKIFTFMRDKLQENGQDWADITEVHFFAGPGSFTGLRIGAAVVNALVDELKIPLYDHHGKRLPLILPEYGRPANISTPRK